MQKFYSQCMKFVFLMYVEPVLKNIDLEIIADDSDKNSNNLRFYKIKNTVSFRENKLKWTLRH